MFRSALLAGLVFATGLLQSAAYDNTRSDNLAVYWGQNSYGAVNPDDTANWQQPISYYCNDDIINAFPVAFLNVFFSTGGYPEINLANTCSSTDNGVFDGTNLANCQFLAADIEACQAAGKIVTLSLGGATGSDTFTDDAQAEAFADTIWNLFLGGSNDTRPFGDAVLDGVDLDIEGGGSTGFAAFVTQLRSYTDNADKSYYITAAPQCPFPDAYLGTVLDAVAFDAVYVQYNNYCEVSNYDDSNDWDFGTWDNWAKTTAINSDVKVYIGAPASSSAAGSGYVDAATLGSIAQATREEYSSFGGIMLWDASQAYANDRYDEQVKSAMGTGAGSGTTATSTSSSAAATSTSTTSTTTSTSTTTTSTTSSAAATTTVGTSGCSGVSAWVSTDTVSIFSEAAVGTSGPPTNGTTTRLQEDLLVLGTTMERAPLTAVVLPDSLNFKAR
ncbi:hypothetical protein H0H92_006328 [Tricholoma furcatifolium]|nr:hypothetical protein H0H92_006328 [Tricholoma furcatifolium]